MTAIKFTYDGEEAFIEEYNLDLYKNRFQVNADVPISLHDTLEVRLEELTDKGMHIGLYAIRFLSPILYYTFWVDHVRARDVFATGVQSHLVFSKEEDAAYRQLIHNSCYIPFLVGHQWSKRQKREIVEVPEDGDWDIL